MSINRVMISGNLTRDAELRSTQSGTSMLGMGIAVNDRRKTLQTEGDAPSRSNELRCNAGDIKGTWRRASPIGSRRRPAGEPANIRLRRRASV